MNARQRANLEKMCPDALKHHDRIAASTPLSDFVDFERASGSCDCFVCGVYLYDHPQHPFIDSIIIDCEGQFWKL